MQPDPQSTHPRIPAIAAGMALFFILLGVYLLTYRGYPLSQDEYFIVDIAESVARRGEFYRTYQFAEFNDMSFGPNGEPWADPNQEPLATVLLAPVIWVGQQIDGAGTLHIALLFNLFVTALTGVSVYIGARLLGYEAHIAWLSGLIYGVGTVAWPYSRHLFREPLLAVFVIWCFVLAMLVRRGWQHGLPWREGALLLGAFGGAFLTKSASVLLLPGLLILLIPPLDNPRARRRVFTGMGTLALLALGLMVFVVLVDSTRERYSVDFWRTQLESLRPGFLLESLLGYQFSFSRSQWLYSPPLLLGLAGVWLLVKRRDWRAIAGVGLTIVLFSASYGLAHSTSWWGGWGWGPRYMVPLIGPILLLWVLPVLPQLKSRLHWAGLWLLVGLGAALNLIGIAVPLPNYYTDLNWTGILTDWATQPQWASYNWTWSQSPLKYHIERLDFNHLDFAWRWADPGWVGPLGALALIALAAGAGWRGARRKQVAWTFIASDALLVTTFAIMAAGIVTLRGDARYIEGRDDVRELVEQLDDAAHPDELVFVDRDLYLPLVMNWLKTPELVANLPYAPGENYGDGPEVVSDDPVEQIGALSVYAIYWALNHYDSVWLLASSGPFEPDKIRPIERYLALNAFPVSSIEVSQQARAIRFLAAPMAEAPVMASDAVFGGELALTGYALPGGTLYAPGDPVPISLEWTAAGPVSSDYNISVQIAGADGVPIVQRDGAPQGTFGFTSRWTEDQTYRDNHGLMLPADLPPGEYRIQIIVYRWQDGTRLPVTVAGTDAGDVLRLVTIAVQGD